VLQDNDLEREVQRNRAYGEYTAQQSWRWFLSCAQPFLLKTGATSCAECWQSSRHLTAVSIALQSSSARQWAVWASPLTGQSWS